MPVSTVQTVKEQDKLIEGTTYETLHKKNVNDTPDEIVKKILKK